MTTGVKTMNKQEYLSELEAHLASLSEEERNDALRFYEEYFEDAGPENEQQVISELGKPFALAKSIICEQSAYSKSKSFANYKASISANYNSASSEEVEPDVAPDTAPQQPHTQYTAYNYADSNSSSASNENTDEKFGSYDKYKESYGGYNNDAAYSSNTNTNNNNYDNSYKRNGNNSRSYSSGSSDTVGFVLFVLLIVFVIAPAVITLGCIAFGLLIGAIGCLIGALVVLLVAIFKMSAFYLGASILCAGLTMIFLPIGLLLAVKLLPKIVKWTAKTVKNLAGGVIE